MIDYNKEIVTALSPILPTHYEMVLHSGLTTPCYSYMEINNYAMSEYTDASTLGYSRVSYQIKVWSKVVKDLQYYASLADEALRKIGLKRVSSGELYDNNSSMIQKIMTYEGIALEEYK